MKQFFCLLIILSTMLASCSKENEFIPPVNNARPGTYSLVRISGGITGATWTLSPELVVWDINQHRDSISIINTNPGNGIYTGPATGTYSFEVRNDSGDLNLCEQSLYINNTYSGCYSSSNGTMIINDVYADGYLYMFQEN